MGAVVAESRCCGVYPWSKPSKGLDYVENLCSMRLTYSHVYSYENKYNMIGGNALNNLKKITKMFLQYSHKIIEIKERPPKRLLLLTSIH